LAIVLVLALASPSSGQTCTTTATNTNGMSMYVQKRVHFTFTGTFDIKCVEVSEAQAQCSDGDTYLVNAMSSAIWDVEGQGTGASPMCGFACGQGSGQNNTLASTWCTVSLSATDGLPVELLDFEVVPPPGDGSESED
jgi:hypothetical protein